MKSRSRRCRGVRILAFDPAGRRFTPGRGRLVGGGGQHQADAREVRFRLFGQTAFTYTVTASSTAGTYSFSGVLRNSDREDVPVGGALTIAVAAGDPLIVRYDANGNRMI